MGLLIDGVWHDRWYDTGKSRGEYVREASAFHQRISAHPEAQFPAAAGRYHLYVSLACPWAHRTLIFRRLKGLEHVISVSVVHPHMLEQGWELRPCDAGPFDSGDPLHDYQYLHQVYTRASPEYTGRVTVPVLWDKQNETIVNNESAEIIRMLNGEFAAWSADTRDYYPAAHRAEICRINERVYENVNNGVYRCGFATTQEAYESAFERLFSTLDELEARLDTRRYLLGADITEADWRLFTTLVRFDAVYVGHFKTNKRRIGDYPNLSNYLRELYQQPGIAATVNFEHIKQHYYYSHATINPTRIVPRGPELDLDSPHDRRRFD